MTMDSIAVIGAGIVGQSWAISFARGGFAVRLYDVAAEACEEALLSIGKALDDLQRRDLLSGLQPRTLSARITTHVSLEQALDGVVHVQENAPERLELKRQLFADLDRLTPPEATIASSTSALLPSAFATGLPGAARCMVAHPLNPPHLIPAVEIVPAPFTAPEAVARCRDVLTRAGQKPIVMTREIPGFVMNRLQGALLDEAVSLVAEGLVAVEDIDSAMRDGLARRWVFMGPFETIDLNAPGGIAGFIERYGPAYAEIGQSRPDRRAWANAIAEKLVEARRSILPLDALKTRQQWRDGELARLAEHFKTEVSQNGTS